MGVRSRHRAAVSVFAAVAIRGAAAFAVLAAMGCSSAPKAPDADYARRNEAARLVSLGAKAGRDGQWTDARVLYEEAYRTYTAADDHAGRIEALDGLAGCYARLEAAALSSAAPTVPVPAVAPVAPAATTDAAASPAAWGRAPTTEAACLSLMAGIAADAPQTAPAAELRARVALPAAEAALRGVAAGGAAAESAALLADSVAESMVAAASALEKRPPDRARAFRILGEARKIRGDAAGALKALEDAAEIELKLKRFVEYAFVRYTAASIHSKSGDYASARDALRDALDADRKAEHAAGIGSDYVALGLVAERSGEFAEAVRHYAAAREVFAAARMTKDATEADKRRAAASARIEGK